MLDAKKRAGDSRSGQDSLDDLPFFGRADESLVQPLETIRKTVSINAHQMQDGRLQVANGHFILDDVVTQFVRLAERDARFHATAGHPDCETVRVMIAPEEL